MRYKFLKKFNESDNQNELSFDDFKNILDDLVDEFDYEYKYEDFSDDLYYQCTIEFLEKEGYENHDDIPDMNLKYLEDTFRERELIGDPFLEKDFEDVFNAINNNISDLEKVKNDLDDIININKNIKSVFKQLENISKRFSKFSNFESCNLEFYGTTLTIMFIIK